jgi:hypothetical protein
MTLDWWGDCSACGVARVIGKDGRCIECEQKGRPAGDAGVRVRGSEKPPAGPRGPLPSAATGEGAEGP